MQTRKAALFLAGVLCLSGCSEAFYVPHFLNTESGTSTVITETESELVSSDGSVSSEFSLTETLTIPTTNTTTTVKATTVTATKTAVHTTTTTREKSLEELEEENTPSTTIGITTATQPTTGTTAAPPPSAQLRSGKIKESTYMSHFRVRDNKGTLYDGSDKESLQKAVSLVVKMEMGSASFAKTSTEAWKAQAVAAYTFLLRNGWNGTVFEPGKSLDLNNANDKKIYDAVGDVLGVKLLDTTVSDPFKSLCTANYSACSAGVTSSSSKVWSAQLPYLKSVPSPVETQELISKYSGMQQKSTYTTTFTALKATIEKWLEAQEPSLSQDNKIYADSKAGEPAVYATEWDGGVGYYVAKTNLYYIAPKKSASAPDVKVYLKGSTLRGIIGSGALRSHAFTVKQTDDTLTFTVMGYGHGVGMSQLGAVIYANEKGWDYIRILQHYYSITPTSAHQLVAPLW